jgi:hypothetical protein
MAHFILFVYNIMNPTRHKSTKGKKTKLKRSSVKTKEMDLINFIKKSSLQKIKKELVGKITNNDTCDKFLGRGMMGSVKLSKIGNTHEVILDNKKVNIPVVIKDANDNNELDINIIKGDLFISTYINITGEAIILTYIYDIWKKGINPHLPLLIGYSKCNKDGRSPVDRIITERHGLPNEITVKIPGIYDAPMWMGPNDNVNKKNPTYKTSLATMGQLYEYIYMNQTGDNIVLPNNEKCNITELLDYIAISYLVTHDLLEKNNMSLSDMHSDNIFLHWLNADSYMGDKNISNTKYIYYKYKNKYLKIKTFGFILKIGDVGTFIIKPKPNVYICGHVSQIKENFDLVKETCKRESCHVFIAIMAISLPHSIVKKTVTYQIMTSYPYDELKWYALYTKHKNAFLPPTKLLAYYSKYLVNKATKANTTLVI